MPRYDYTCGDCSHIWEEDRKISEYKVPCESLCPNCGKTGKIEIYHSSATTLIDPVKLGVQKLPQGFNQVLQNIGSRMGQSLNHSFSTRREI